MKMIFFTLVLALIALGCVQEPTTSLPAIESAPQYNESTIPDNLLCFGGECIEIERALSPAEQSTGLMFRESLCEKCGMLFLFSDEKQRTFWMKNTLIPLDMVWIDSEKKVVGVTENALPCRTGSCPLYYSTAPAKYVLEINAGTAQKIGLEKGMAAVFGG